MSEIVAEINNTDTRLEKFLWFWALLANLTWEYVGWGDFWISNLILIQFHRSIEYIYMYIEGES